MFVYPLFFKMQMQDSLICIGARTVTAAAQRLNRASTHSSSAGNLHLTQITAVWFMFNASGVALSYIRRCNFTAVRRKLTWVLFSINQISRGA